MPNIPKLPNIFAGDDVSWVLNFTDSAGNPIDLTGATINFIVKSDKTAPDSAAVIDKDITSHTDPTQGESKLVLTDIETDVTPNVYYGEFTYISAVGALITTLASTQITILEKARDA